MIATGAAAIAVVLATIGLLHLLVVLRRTLSGDQVTPDPPAR